MNIVMDVQGKAKERALQRALRPASLRRELGGLVRLDAERVLVPPLSRVSPRGTDSPWSRKGASKRRAGPMYQRMKTRKVKLREREIAAVTTGPRTWYAHMVVRGTNPHMIGSWMHPGARSQPFPGEVASQSSTVAALKRSLLDDIRYLIKSRSFTT